MPVWYETIDVRDVWGSDDHWTQKRDQVVAIFRKSRWYKDSFQVQDLVDELEEALNVYEFDSIWNSIYDEADRDRIWIATF